MNSFWVQSCLKLAASCSHWCLGSDIRTNFFQFHNFGEIQISWKKRFITTFNCCRSWSRRCSKAARPLSRSSRRNSLTWGNGWRSSRRGWSRPCRRSLGWRPASFARCCTAIAGTTTSCSCTTTRATWRPWWWSTTSWWDSDPSCTTWWGSISSIPF